jgi:hypothetical protein
MSSINPFSGYLAQGSQVERTQAADKTRQVRRTQALSKDVAAKDDQLEHQVESADAIVEIHDEQNPAQGEQKQQKKKQQGEEGKEEPPRLDLTA